MGATVDSLEIKIQTQATRANNAINGLVGNLEKLSNTLGRINGGGLSNLAAGVTKLSTAMQGMNSLKTADFTRLSKNISKLGSIDSVTVNRTAISISKLSKAFGQLAPVASSAVQVGEMAKAISKLGNKSVQTAITNMPKLATSLNSLMATLSKAPRVSQNLISMTNALANLTSQGARVGSASNSMVSRFNKLTVSTQNTRKAAFSLAATWGKLYASFWVFIRAFRLLGKAIDISSDLTEVQNVVDQSFGDMAYKVDNLAKNSIQDYGMSELTVKDISSRYQAMGKAMGFANDEMSDMSIKLTELAADMASFYNVEQKDVAEDLESIFTGQTRPLRTYGMDLTQATLQEWALKNGIDANMQSMSQAEKTMLRYQYVMAQSAIAQGDFARTSGRICAA